jgi:hypothetical protein
MGAIIMCSFLMALAVGFYIFDKTAAGKRFFAENE